MSHYFFKFFSLQVHFAIALLSSVVVFHGPFPLIFSQNGHYKVLDDLWDRDQKIFRGYKRW